MSARNHFRDRKQAFAQVKKGKDVERLCLRSDEVSKVSNCKGSHVKVTVRGGNSFVYPNHNELRTGTRIAIIDAMIRFKIIFIGITILALLCAIVV